MTGFESDPGDEQPDRFWPETNWHANGLPTPAELARSNRLLSAITKWRIETSPMVPPGHVEVHDDCGIVIRRRFWKP